MGAMVVYILLLLLLCISKTSIFLHAPVPPGAGDRLGSLTWPHTHDAERGAVHPGVIPAGATAPGNLPRSASHSSRCHSTRSSHCSSSPRTPARGRSSAGERSTSVGVGPGEGEPAPARLRRPHVQAIQAVGPGD